MTKSVNHLLKGDRRAALASFGSVMRATKEKANAAMAQAKTRIKEATMGATGGTNLTTFRRTTRRRRISRFYSPSANS